MCWRGAAGVSVAASVLVNGTGVRTRLTAPHVELLPTQEQIEGQSTRSPRLEVRKTANAVQSSNRALLEVGLFNAINPWRSFKRRISITPAREGGAMGLLRSPRQILPHANEVLE